MKSIFLGIFAIFLLSFSVDAQSAIIKPDKTCNIYHQNLYESDDVVTIDSGDFIYDEEINSYSYITVNNYSMNQNLENIAEVTDELENLHAALSIPMPDKFHVDQFKSILPDKIQKIRNAIVNETGEDPWY